ncbi:MAG: bacteriophage Gp15 family protein [Erysipelotrichaceae bacterium]|nr:bacteriophage Gp15 family protein [Erysipelotrichaceae bacterium]
MNILTDKLPTKIRVNENIYDINYDYKTAIKTLMAFEDDELTQSEKYYILLNNIYKQEIPQCDEEEAIFKAIKFLNLGVDSETNSNKESPRVYSFSKDASYIYSGISQTHKVDLEKESNLHFWKFMSLFMDMTPECMFGELVYYRKRKQEGKLTKEEKQQYEKIKDLVDLERVKVKSEERRKFFEEFNR